MSQVVLKAHSLEKRILLAGIEDKSSHKIEHYLQNFEGYSASKKACSMQPEQIIAQVKESGLRGLGGAGFPAGVKWGFVPKNPKKPVYLVCNADEGEPGTFKDRQIMEHCPHRLIDGMIATALSIGSKIGYIYVRCELTLAIERLEEAIKEAYEKGYLGSNIFGSEHSFDLTVHLGAGAYICGEETGLISSLEGDRGEPRLKPPFPAVEGLFGGPTIVNNVATLAHVPGIINNGTKWFQDLGQGTERCAGTNIVSVSGDVKNPGYFELPLGTNLKTILYDLCGGPLEGRKLKACFPGGSSAPVLKEDEFDVGWDFDSLAKAGSMAGSGAVIVMDDRRSMPEIAMMTARFYAHESCGQCVPCREGTNWTHHLLEKLVRGEASKKEIDYAYEACENMEGKTICVLTEACSWPVRSLINKFRSEFEALALPDDQVKKIRPRISGELSNLVNLLQERKGL